MMTKYLDPKNDFAFKKIFGEEKHKQIPINFLNAVLNLEGADLIEDLEFLNPVLSAKIASNKESIVDVLVRDQKGHKYVVEMQVAKVEGFEKRAQYYAAKTYCSHFRQGGEYLDLKKVIFLAITSYTVFPKKESYKSDHRILDDKTHEHDLKDFYFTFVELPKFTKAIDELETIEEKWYYFLKHATDSSSVPEALLSAPGIDEAYSVIERCHWDDAEMLAYEQVDLNEQDYRNGLKAAKEEGRLEERRALVKQLLSAGFLTDAIAKMINISEKEVEQIL